MKVLIYTHEFLPFLGGLGTTSLKLSQGLTERGYEVLVLAPNYPDAADDNGLDFKVHRMTSLTRNHGIPTPVKEFAGFLSLRNVLRTYRPDALIALTREAHASCGLNLKMLPDISIARVAGYEAMRYLLRKMQFDRSCQLGDQRSFFEYGD